MTFTGTFTGTLIESLMATVQRAERKTTSVGELTAVQPIFGDMSRAEPMLVEPALAEPWFVSVQENADYDSKFIGVA
jgi:hypothetical protein